MQELKTIKKLAAMVPAIPVGSTRPSDYIKWREANHDVLTIEYLEAVRDTGKMTFERYCQWAFKHNRDFIEPTLN